MKSAVNACPCGALLRGKPLAYADCCGRYHAGALPPTPEALMRSRYSAFVQGLTDYLRTSWHPSTCPADLQADPHTQWLGLTVKAARQWPAEGEPEYLGQPEPVTAWGEVSFVARWREHGRGQRLEEVSRFALQAGRWTYVDGVIKGEA